MPNTQILPSNIGHSSGTSLLSYPFNIAFYLFYLYLNSEPNEFDTYKIILNTIDPNTGLFSDSEIKSKFDFDTSIFFWDDGLIFAIYQNTSSITNILDLFTKFSTVSGLRISPAKSKIIPINFHFSKSVIDILEGYGLKSENFSDYFTFLGNFIYPDNLAKGVKGKSFENRSKRLKIKG